MKDTHFVCAEDNPHRLGVIQLVKGRSFERPLENVNDVIARVKADQHRYTRNGKTFDQDPPKVLEVFEKRLYRPPLFLLLIIKAIRSRVIGHRSNRSATHALGPGDD